MQNTLLGPGRYEISTGGFSDAAVDERASGPGWARAYEVQRLAALPHLLHKQQWELKRMLVRHELCHAGCSFSNENHNNAPYVQEHSDQASGLF